MNWIEILTHSYEVHKGLDSCPPDCRLEYLGDHIFGFTTYDGEMSALFARKAVDVADAITNGTTLEYIKDAENYRWYLLMCNTDFFSGRLEWGTSIRGAWWDHKISYQSCGLWKGEEQLHKEMTFTQDEWKEFMRAVSAFANHVISKPHEDLRG